MTRTYAGQLGGSDYKQWMVQRTDGSDTVLAPLGVEAEPEIATYVIQFAGIAISVANSHVCQVMAGASLRVGIRRIEIWQVANANAIALAQYRLFRLTSAGTGGSSITPAAYDPAESAAGATAMTLPSAKGTESTQVGHGRHLIHTTATTVGLVRQVWDFTKLRTKALWIASGTSNGVALKNISSDSTATVDGFIEIVETSVA